jgi:hypothetical protein
MRIKKEVCTIEEQELTREDLENLISEELCKI